MNYFSSVWMPCNQQWMLSQCWTWLCTSGISSQICRIRQSLGTESGHHYRKKGHKSAHFALHMLIVNYVDAGGLWLYLTARVSDFDMECI